MKNTFLVDVNLAGPCNFDCYYCYVDKKTRRRKDFGKLSTSKGQKKLLELLDELGSCEVSLCGTGEAGLLPNFFELCEAITGNHYLTLITNLSFSDSEFIKRIPSKRVFGIIISLHPEHEEDINRFFQRVELYQDNTYPIAITYVAHPLRIKNIPSLYKRFDEMGIDFRIAVFDGIFNGKKYPKSYSNKEQNVILSYITTPSTYHRLIRGFRLHKGKICNAGYASFYLDDETGDIKRCSSGNTILGNLFRGKIKIPNRPLPCDTYICGCDKHAEEERKVNKYYQNALTERGNLKVFTKKDAEWYMPLCEPIWEEYESVMPELLRNDVRYIADSSLGEKVYVGRK